MIHKIWLILCHFRLPDLLLLCLVGGLKTQKNQNYYDAIKNHKSHTLFNSNQDPFFIGTLFATSFWWQSCDVGDKSQSCHQDNFTSKNVSMIIGFEQALFNFKHFSFNLTIPSTFFNRIYIYSLVLAIWMMNEANCVVSESYSKNGIQSKA